MCPEEDTLIFRKPLYHSTFYFLGKKKKICLDSSGVEQWIEAPRVDGSNPSLDSTNQRIHVDSLAWLIEFVSVNITFWEYSVHSMVLVH